MIRRSYILAAAAFYRVLHPGRVRSGCRHAELMAEVNRVRLLRDE